MKFEVFFADNKGNDQGLLVMHSLMRQILAFQVGERDKVAEETLMEKHPIELKKAQFYTGKFLDYYEVIS